MRKGKMVAQGAHALMKAILDNMTPVTYGMTMDLQYDSPLKNWIEGIFTKICVGVDSEEELFDIFNKAQSAGLICSLITDL